MSSDEASARALQIFFRGIRVFYGVYFTCVLSVGLRDTNHSKFIRSDKKLDFLQSVARATETGARSTVSDRRSIQMDLQRAKRGGRRRHFPPCNRVNAN